MRSVLLAALSMGMVCHTSRAQLVWQNAGDTAALSGYSFGMTEDESHNLLLTMSGALPTFLPDARTYRIAPDGAVLDNIAYTFPGEGAYWGSLRLLDTINGGYDMFSDLVIPGTGDVTAYLYHRADSALHILSTDTMPFPEHAHLNGYVIMREPSGDMVVVAGMNTAGNNYPPDRLYWLRMDTNGELLETRTYPGSSTPYGATPTAEGFTLICTSAALGPIGPYKVLRFDHDFNYLGGFALPDVNGVSPVLGQDSIPEPTDMIVLPNGKVVVSADFWDTWGPDYLIPCVIIYAADGTMERIRYATYTEQSRTVPRGLTDLGDGTFSWGYLEGLEYDVGNKTHVLVLDTAMDIRSEVVYDGLSQGIHAFPYEVLPAYAGGFYLCGYMHYVGVYTLHAWVAKIDRTVGLSDHGTSDRTTQVYPNPGVGFTAYYSGAVGTARTVGLYDVQGHLVVESSMFMNRANIDGTALASGIYLYRVTDQAGNVLGSGRWARE